MGFYGMGFLGFEEAATSKATKSELEGKIKKLAASITNRERKVQFLRTDLFSHGRYSQAQLFDTGFYG